MQSLMTDNEESSCNWEVFNLSPVEPKDNVVNDSHILRDIYFASPSLSFQTQEMVLG